jgi:phage shock protein C
MIFRNRLYLDKDRAKLAGVCAGIADFLGWDVTAVRVCWVIATLFWAPVMIVGYVLAAWLLDPKPGSTFTRSRMRAYDFEPPTEPISPRYRFADAKARFDQLERRLRDLEGVVTSREFQMDRELRGTGRS